MTPKQALWLLIAGSAVVRLICAFNLGLGNDEAYHFLYAAHPALSYYDHPPMMAWVEMAGLILSATRASAWALRIGFIVLFGGSTWLLARVTARSYGPRAGLLAAFALNVTGYYGLAAATFALPDGPLLFFWLLTIDRLEIALADPDSETTETLGLGGPGLGRGHAQQVSRRADPAWNGPVMSSCIARRGAGCRSRGPTSRLAWGLLCSVRSCSGMPATAGRRFCSRGAGRSGAGRSGPIISPWRSWPRQAICSRGSGDH